MTISQIKNLVIIILAGLVIFLTRDYFEKDEVVVDVPLDITLDLPEIKNTLDTIHVPKPFNVEVENPINKKLLEDYNNAKDTIAKLQKYKDAIAIREYNERFEDDSVRVDVYTQTRGTILKQSTEYLVKSRKVRIDTVIKTVVKVPKQNKLFVTGEVGLPIDNPNINTPVLRGGLIFKNKKDFLIKATIDNRKYVSIGLGIRL